MKGITNAKSVEGPDAYIKSASVNGNSLTLTKQDDTTETFTPANDHEPAVFIKSASVNGNSLTLTKQDDTTETFTPPNDHEPAAFIKSASVSGDTLTLVDQNNVGTTFTPSGGADVSMNTTTGSESITVDNGTLNVMTRNTAQTITAAKTFQANAHIYLNTDAELKFAGGSMSIGQHFTKWLFRSNYNDAGIELSFRGDISPLNDSSYTISLGNNNKRFNDIWFRGSLKDGTNTLSLAQIAAKSTVSVNNTGTSTTELPDYMTINGDEYKIPKGTPSVVISKDTQSISATLRLSNHTSHRFTLTLASLSLLAPSSIPDDFECEIVFHSGTTATTFSQGSMTIQWSGDDVSNNTFTPVSIKTYNILFWYDSINLNAIVRGV